MKVYTAFVSGESILDCTECTVLVELVAVIFFHNLILAVVLCDVGILRRTNILPGNSVEIMDKVFQLFRIKGHLAAGSIFRPLHQRNGPCERCGFLHHLMDDLLIVGHKINLIQGDLFRDPVHFHHVEGRIDGFGQGVHGLLFRHGSDVHTMEKCVGKKFLIKNPDTDQIPDDQCPQYG